MDSDDPWVVLLRINEPDDYRIEIREIVDGKIAAPTGAASAPACDAYATIGATGSPALAGPAPAQAPPGRSL